MTHKIPATIAIAATLLAQVSFGNPEIIVDNAAPGIFPKSWLESPYYAEAEELPKREQRAVTKIVGEEMEKYPKAILRDNLKKTYVVSRLVYNGVPTGGTNSRSSVYLVRNDRSTEANLRRSFHAELSSILLRNNPDSLDKEAWSAANPADFAYGKGGVAAIQTEKASLRLREELHERGFLHEYATASLQEDFNSYAARLFVGDKDLWEAIERHPKVKEKAELTMAFYKKVSASFTGKFFESLR